MFFLYYDRTQYLRHNSINSAEIIQNLSPFKKADKRGIFEKSPIYLIQCINWNTASSLKELSPFHDLETKITIASWARIDNRGELAEALGFSLNQAIYMSDSEVIFNAYLKWGEDCASHLVGDFVFALYDYRLQRVFCARDHIGARPLYYYLSPDRFICATTLSALIALDSISFEIERQWIVDYLLRISMSFDCTPYQGIRKLPPAHCLTIDTKTHRLNQYFQISEVPELKLKDSREYVDAYKEQLSNAVKCRVETEYSIASELSGGIDSSSVTALAARFFSQPLSQFHAFGFACFDHEPRYILSVSQALNLPHTHIFTNQQYDFEDMAQRSLKILGYPAEHNVSIRHEPFYRLAEKLGVRTIISGFGGDEFASTIYSHLVPADLIAQHRYKDLYRILPGNEFTRFLRLIQIGSKQVLSMGFAKPEYYTHLYEVYVRRWEQQLVRKEWVEQYNLRERYFNLIKFNGGHTNLKKFILEKQWLPFIPTRMENCALMASARKIEYRWPLLDIRLIRLFFSIPSEEHYYRGMGRYLYRRAIQGVVPDLITWKKGKAMGSLVCAKYGKNSFPIQIETDDLHPKLIEVLDVEKLNRRVAYVHRSACHNYPNIDSRINRDLWIIKYLDRWLRQRFPVD